MAFQLKTDLNLDGWGPYPGGDELGAHVAEVGSYSTKIGFAGEDQPRCVFRSESAVLREDGAGAGASVTVGAEGGSGWRTAGRIKERSPRDWWNRPFESDGSDGKWEVATPLDGGTGLVFEAPASGPSPSSSVGSAESPAPASSNSNDAPMAAAEDDPESLSSSLRGDYPGRGECHSLLSSYLRRGVADALGSAPSDAPLILIDRSYAPPPLRQKSLEVLFEDLGVPSAFLARDAVMACYSVGRATGTVVDVGHSGTVVTPVFDGYVENRGILRSGSGTGGAQLDREVLRTLDRLVASERAARKKARKRAQLAAEGVGTAPVPVGDGLGLRWERWRDEMDTAMPPYQARSRKAKLPNGRRSDAMHLVARMELARQCKEMGYGAAAAQFGYVSCASVDDFNAGNAETASAAGAVGAAPDAESELSDEAKRVREQYAAAPTPSYDLPDGTAVEMPPLSKYDATEVFFGNDPLSSKRREEGVANVRGQLNELLSDTSEGIKGGGGGGGNTTDGGGNDNEDDDAYSEAMGSTISSTGLRSVKTSFANKSASARRKGRTHAALSRAALPYLTSHLPDLTAAPLQGMVCDSAFRCDRDQQSQLLGNVVLCGGGACVGPDEASFPDRLRDEVEALIHAHTPGWRVKVLAADRRERRYASWLGASIMGSVGAFADFYVTKAEYEEQGARIANRKCP